MGDVFSAVQSYLSAVGIDAALDAADHSRYVNAYTNGWKGLIQMYVTANPSQDSLRPLTVALSSKRTRFVSVDIPANYDSMLWAAYSDTDPVKRLAEAKGVMKAITDQYLLFIPMFLNQTIAVNYSTVHGMTLVDPGKWFPQNVWLSK